MSILLFGAGALAVVIGIAMVGFGVPVSEFSFGNTLIISGTMAVVGGLIVIGLGSAVSHLQRISEMLAARTPARSGRLFDTLEPGPAAAPGRIPFPPKPKVETGMREPLAAAPMAAPAAMPFKDQPPQSPAPSLPNPDEPPVTVEDDVSLSPQHPAPARPQTPVDLDEAARQSPPFGIMRSRLDEKRDEASEPDTDWHAPPAATAESPQARQPHTTFFDTMWPAEPKPAKSPPERDEAPEPAFEPPSREAAPEAAAAEPEPVEEPAPPAEGEPRAVAILKSGVVDGMGYTLYVDGSIEAELPNGTLRFASINELRSHLEKTS